MTLGVYGLVAGIVKLDDLGLWLHAKGSSFAQALGRGICGLPLVDERPVGGWHRGDVPSGGGILVHGIPVVHHAVEAWAVSAAAWPAGSLWSVVVPNGLNAIFGLAAGALVLVAVTLIQRLRGRSAH